MIVCLRNRRLYRIKTLQWGIWVRVGERLRVRAISRYLLFHLVPAIQPRWLVTLDEDNPMNGFTLTLKYSLIFSNFSEKFGSKKIGLSYVYVDPELFRKVREACRNNFHQFSSNSIRRIPSYDPKTKNFND